MQKKQAKARKSSSNQNGTSSNTPTGTLWDRLKNIPLPAFRREISKEVRAFVLDRNGFTCQMCGAVAGEPHPDDPSRKTRLHIGQSLINRKAAAMIPLISGRFVRFVMKELPTSQWNVPMPINYWLKLEGLPAQNK